MPRKRFAVVIKRLSGRVTTVDIFDTRADAIAARDRLKAAGEAAELRVAFDWQPRHRQRAETAA
jgi:hypothetical protein